MFRLVFLTTAFRLDKLTFNKAYGAEGNSCLLQSPPSTTQRKISKGDSPRATHTRNQQTHKCRKKQQQRLPVTSLK